MKMKISNIVLLGFYLTLVFGLVVFLLGARSYIQNEYPKENDPGIRVGPKTKILNNQINHLVFLEGISPGGIILGDKLELMYYENDKPFESSYKIVGDTLILMNRINILSLQLANKVKSIQFENVHADIPSRILEQNAHLSFLGHHRYLSRVFFDGGNLSNLSIELHGSQMEMIIADMEAEMSVDTLKVELHNSQIDVSTEVGKIINTVVVNSHSRGDRVSVSSGLFKKLIVNERID